MVYEDLMTNYPRAQRDVSGRGLLKTEEDRRIAREFGREFFDGERRHGYGGLSYHPKYWTQVVDDMINFYGLNNDSRILDVGCARGFMLVDFKKALPKACVAGIDISEYAIATAHPDVRPFLQVANATHLPFEDSSFDFVVSINTVHNLELEDLRKSLTEIERVSAGNSYIVVDSFGTSEEKSRILDWNLTAQTILSDAEWVQLFEEVGFSGEYSWFKP